MKTKIIAAFLVALTLLSVPGAIDGQVARRQIVEEFRDNKAASAKSLMPAIPGEKFISIPGPAFHFVAGNDPSNIDLINTPGSVVIWDKTVAIAPIQLPHGAVITYFAASMGDSNPSAAGVITLTQSRTNNNVQVARLVSPNSWRMKEKEVTSKYRRVSNRIGGYFLAAQGVSGKTNFFGIDYVVIGYMEN